MIALAQGSQFVPGQAAGGLGFDLLRPGLWPLLFVAALVLALGLWALARRRRERAVLVHERHLQRFFPRLSEGRARVRLAGAALGALALVLALLGPVRGYTERDVFRRGVDLVICIDTSRSMLARDVRPTRLERAEREVGGLLDRLSGDRVALLAFSGDVREVAPLTHDRAVLQGLAAQLDPDDNQLGGTDLGVALERALEMFDGRTGAHEAVVVLTDGEDLEGRGAEVAQVAAERGIRIYVVGVGTAAGGKIPFVDETGRESFVRDPSGAEVVSQLSGESLARMAELSGGSYLSTEQSPTPLEDLYRARISKLDKRALEGGKEWVPHDRYQWVLVLAFAGWLIELGLRERGRRTRSPLAAATSTGRRQTT